MNFIFAAERRESYWSGCIKVSIVRFLSNFLRFGGGDFSFFKIPVKKFFKIAIFSVQALYKYKVVLGRTLCKLCSAK
jgi:hypothetical protein